MFAFFTVLSVLAFILGVVAYAVGLYIEDEGAALGGGITLIIGAMGIILFGILSFNWDKARTTAQLLNMKHGTEFTTDQVFYSSKLVQEILGEGKDEK